MLRHGAAIASTKRATVSGSTASVVLQPNARSVNATSSAPVASAAAANAVPASCDQ